jgi:hypothetical protein
MKATKEKTSGKKKTVKEGKTSPEAGKKGLNFIFNKR